MKNLIAVLMLFAAGAWAQTCPTSPPDLSAVTAALDKEMHANGTPGAALVLVCGGKVVLAEGFGQASVETGSPVTASTLFRLGSTSKIFTGLALASLAEQGKIKLNQPIGTYVKGLGPQLSAVTLHQLLTHSAGLWDDAPQDGSHDDSALAANVRSWKEDLLLAEPGRVFSYANTGYVLAGYVLEQVYGKPFADAVSELVLQPIGMKSATFRPLVAMTYPLAIGHRPTPQGPQVIRPFADHAGAWPPGSLFSSAQEMAAFMNAVLNQETSAMNRVLSPHVKIAAMGSSYGYGVMIQDEGGQRIIRHTGGRAGYGSVFHMAPAHRAGVAILANRSGAIFGRVARMALAAMLGIPESAPTVPSRNAAPMSTDEMQRYAGVYENYGPIRAELLVRDEKLLAKFGGREFPVQKVGEWRFHAPGGAQLTDFLLTPGADGRPEFLSAEAWTMRRRP